MNSLERMQAAYLGRIPDRIPFVPIIREHSARLIDKTPSEVARDAALMAEAQLAAYEIYRHDMVSVGIDTYNIECEAVGARVVYFYGPEMPAIAEPLIEERAQLEGLRVPDPEQAGRMPVILEAGSRLLGRVGQQVAVNCTVVGPFTLAVNLRGFERLIMDLFEAPEFVHRLLAFATNVGRCYAEAIRARGLGVSISESWISPPLLSPTLYRELALPYERQLISHIASTGQSHVALISGGDTTPILEEMIDTGASLLVGDYNSDMSQARARTLSAGIVLRANIDPKLVESGPVDRLVQAAASLVEMCSPPKYFIVGTGVVPYSTPPEHLLALRQYLEEMQGFNQG